MTRRTSPLPASRRTYPPTHPPTYPPTQVPGVSASVSALQGTHQVGHHGSWRSAPLPANWPAKRARILRRDGRVCYRCARGGCNEVDHIVPASRGGTDDDSNLAAICTDCHKAKTAREARGESRRRAPERHPGLLGGGG